MSMPNNQPCAHTETTCAYAGPALPAAQAVAAEAHTASRPACRRELGSLAATVNRFAAWPTDVLPPPASLQERLARRIAADAGTQPIAPPARQWAEPAWEQVAPGIECKLLATDAHRRRVSML